MARRLFASLVSLFLVASPSLAQQLASFHDTIVVTAADEPQALDEVDAATTVISGADIEAAGAASVSELLRLVPGATLLRSGEDNGVTTLFVRGTNSAHTLVLFDGVRLNSPFFGGYDWSLPLTAGIGRVEVVRGPYSALYGGDAIGGVVQLLPWRPAGDGLRALFEGGPSGWRRAEAAAAGHVGSLAFTVSGARRDGSGPLLNDDFSSRVATADVSAPLGGGSTLGALVRRTTSRTEIPFTGALQTPHRYSEAAETLAALPLNVRLTPSARLEVVLSRVERDVTFRDPDDPYGLVSTDTTADSDGARVVLHDAWNGQHLMAGAEWRRDRVVDGSNFGVDLAGKSLDTAALFVQDRLGLGRGVDLLAGLRFDRARPWGSELSPRMTVSWNAGWQRVWLSYGTAFRAPALGELYYPLSGNPNLAPERSHNVEVGDLVALAARSVLQVVGFRNRVEDLIDFDFASFRYANVGSAAQDGVELSSITQLGTGSALTVSLTYLDARDGNGQLLLRRPRWCGGVSLRGPLHPGVEGELAVAWVGARDDLDPVSYARVGQGGFVTADASLAFPVSPALRLRLRGENLADRSYQEVRGYPAPGRRLFLAAEVSLH
jgi:vitamin B12 transporter